MTDSILHLGLLDEETLLLDAAALELAALDHPDVDIAPYARILGEIAERVAEVGDDAHTSAEQARLLASVLAAEYGFTGDIDSYDDPANADLMRVIDRRCGLPVSLAILYVAAARRVGWSADALNTPGHVLVRVGADTAPVLIDPFHDGRPVGRERLAALLASVADSNGAIDAAHVAPMSNRMVLSRLLLNQASRAEAAGDGDRARELFERMTVFAPDNAHAWWQRARLQLEGGDTAAARASLIALLEMTREPELRARVSEMLAELPAAGG
ncbi:SirB1 family protein [Sphingomonas jatrophae]|uniref:Regulator of sirC expression, contains transglutaminase-like and TPR domains n=1 Tax=Sphingomonas jatrophae TaxID=1166337 RepID=A0A1I6L1B3_9SPHN|nr:transglutaminase-like domain-containing protein [Sphingomonas jatrophae]SFR97068.1 Regulator of sirC expression, contains transglutaminase-like and TPR domains [Sphingomonas jatrophae]